MTFSWPGAVGWMCGGQLYWFLCTDISLENAMTLFGCILPSLRFLLGEGHVFHVAFAMSVRKGQLLRCLAVRVGFNKRENSIGPNCNVTSLGCVILHSLPWGEGHVQISTTPQGSYFVTWLSRAFPCLASVGVYEWESIVVGRMYPHLP